ncbi:MAG: nitroreductase family protein [Terrisporobacter sp.]
MNTIEAIYARKSVRKFKDEVVPKEDILKMLEAATQATSPKHQQNWNFVVVTNRELINKMADIVTASHERLGEIAKN